MKKILVDTNIIDRNKIEYLLSKNIKYKFKKNLRLYASEILLKQRLVPLFSNEDSNEYNFFINFLKSYFEDQIVDFSGNIARKEIINNFNKISLFGIYKIGYLENKENIINNINNYNAQLNRVRKFDIGNNFKSFLNEIKNDISKLKSKEDWRNYCYNFVLKYDFATKQLNCFLDNRKYYNKETFTDLLILWWNYSTVVGTLRYFNTPKADEKGINIIENNSISKKSFLYHQFKTDEYILKYCFMENKSFDYDSPNDVIYISLMKDFDILLSDDTSFMKECFNYTYKNKNKKILTLKEFIKHYG